jgi:hypothetical protein
MSQYSFPQDADQPSNVDVRSNVILQSMSLKKCMPGDFAALAYAHLMRDVRTRGLHFTQSQINEYRQTIICCYCNMACAGTCGWWKK